MHDQTQQKFQLHMAFFGKKYRAKLQMLWAIFWSWFFPESCKKENTLESLVPYVPLSHALIFSPSACASTPSSFFHFVRTVMLKTILFVLLGRLGGALWNYTAGSLISRMALCMMVCHPFTIDLHTHEKWTDSSTSTWPFQHKWFTQIDFTHTWQKFLCVRGENPSVLKSVFKLNNCSSFDTGTSKVSSAPERKPQTQIEVLEQTWERMKDKEGLSSRTSGRTREKSNVFLSPLSLFCFW